MMKIHATDTTFDAIVVPLDGSSFAEQALPVASMLARSAAATLHLVLVHQPFIVSYTSGAAIVDGVLDAQSRAANNAYLDAVMERLTGTSNLPVVATVLDGPIAHAITDYCAAFGSGLLVMTTSARGRLARMWLGSVADGVIRRSTLPVLLLRPAASAEDEAPALRTMTILLDGSTQAEQVCGPATRLGKLLGCCYRLVQVVEPARLIGYAPHARSIGMEAELTRRLQQEAAEYLDDVAAMLRQTGARVETVVLVDREPARALVEHARHTSSDLIALTTHGRGGIARLLVGSVADKVVRGADQPVLVFHPGPDEDEPVRDSPTLLAARQWQRGDLAGMRDT